MVKNKFYTSVAQHGDRILVREIVDGQERRREVDWSPSLFVKCKPNEVEYTSLFGDNTKRVTFDTIGDARDFVKKYEDVDGFEIYGQQNWVLQYIHQYELGEPVFSEISVTSIDIETEVPESGFPKPSKAEARVVLITCASRFKKPVTFGIKPYDGDDTDYRYCEDESTLFREFLSWWETHCPAIATGWNIEGFDLPYLAVRIDKILGKSQVNRLSPWGVVRVSPDRRDPDLIDVQILGVAVLDYLALMKKYTYGSRPSWSLGAVAAEEIGQTKLDHSEYASFNEFMEKDWPKFVQYNVIDAVLPLRIDDKMKLMDTALTVAYIAKINYQDGYSPVKTWDAIIHNALMDKGIVVPQRKSSGMSLDSIEGGFVKTPIPGFKKHITAFDATSLYPSIMMTLNLSPETYLGLVDSSVDLCLNGVWPNVQDGVAVGANGAMYSKKKRGIIPELVEGLMTLRRTSKNEMLKLKQELEKTGDKSLDFKIAALDNKQMAAKILANALYGAIANAGFRFFNPDIAESITTTGQLYIRSIDKQLPVLMAETFKIPVKDYVCYADTDSVYVSYEEIINKYFSNETDVHKLISIMEKTAKSKIQPLISRVTEEVSSKLSVYDDKISFKLEIAADKAVFVAKKKYVCRVYSSEGVAYAKPKTKVMGLEMIRSSTPMWVRNKLEEVFDLVFSTDEQTLQAFIKKSKDEFLTLPPEDIARPTGVNGLDKSEDSRNIYDRGRSVPIHVRASLLYNHYLKKHGLQTRYHSILEGDKIKYVYLKMPNPIKENVIAWPVDEQLPSEFGLHKYVDYQTQFDKTFLAAVQIVLTAIKWNAEHQSSLDEFFN
jgi:DNA polymerase elongation subunit (family B)